jgi:hypothetical protein
MLRLSILFILLSSFALTHAQKDSTNPEEGNVNIKIPAAWVDKLRHLDYTTDNSSLLREFETFLTPDTPANPHSQHVDPDYGRVLNTLFVNLDGDAANEFIALLGRDITSPYLCVFKEKQGTWYLIYREEIPTMYTSPPLAVANCFSKNKTFYIRRVYQSGSGIYEDGYCFYKLIHNKVYKCLQIVNDAHIYGWGLYLNQAVRTSFEFSSDGDDCIAVDYIYNFFPGQLSKDQCSWCINDNIPLIKGDAPVTYIWDHRQSKYILKILRYPNPLEDLDAAKISCFGDFGNDSLFVRAFAAQIKDVLNTGTAQQKRILTQYLTLVKKETKTSKL